MLPQRHKGVPLSSLENLMYIVWFKVCFKDATGVGFLCSSLRLFQSLIVEGSKELKYWFVCASIEEIIIEPLHEISTNVAV